MPLAAEASLSSIGLIGVGLIGGSFALAARQRWPLLELHAYDPSPAACDWAVAEARMTVHDTIEQLAGSAHLIAIAAPLSHVPEIFKALAGSLGEPPVVIDLTSTKSSVAQQARASMGSAFPRFVACHPIAGGEQSGASHARANLFHGKPVVLTPEHDTRADALQLVLDLWHNLGARTVTMTAERHDELFAYLSHAPHLLAFAYMMHANRLGPDELALAGSGFLDFTRIAASGPELWADILLDNRRAVLEVIEQQRSSMELLSEFLVHQQREPLIAALTMAREQRAILA